MAYLDPFQEQQNLEDSIAYDRLKEHLSGKTVILNVEDVDFLMALRHIRKLEEKAKEQEQQLKEYATFFSLMKKLMPKEFSIHYPLN